jgi:hypothetical protein
MAFTRFHDDPYRIQMQVQNSSFEGRYMLDVPGVGLNMPFFQEPQMRLQKWGANLQTNTVNLESDLFGMTRKINRDNMDLNDYKQSAVSTTPMTFPVTSPFVEESRVSHPAWTYKDLEQNHWEHPWLNPQNGLEPKFHSNIQTRILEKDYYSSNQGTDGSPTPSLNR